MSLRPLLIAGLVGVLGVAAARALPTSAALVVVVIVAVVLGVADAGRDERWMRGLVDEVEGWLANGRHRPLQVSVPAPWRRLTATVDALGAAHGRRGARLEQEQPWRRELVESLGQPALLFSDEGRLLAANDGARTLLRIPREATGTTVIQAVGSATLAATVRRVRETGGSLAVDVEHAEHDLNVVASVVGDETLLIITDRTRERRVEELRRNFVVNASHELKTPVTSIQALAEALQVTVRSDPERSVSLVSGLGVEAERLARLVRDLLDLRRLEERAPLEREPVDVAELVRVTAAELIPRAEAREVSIEVEAPDRARVTGVPGDLETIVKNLIANAVEYNRSGGSVAVSVTSDGGSCVLRVADTGIGIPQHDLGRIFERFYRVDAARSRATGGTGLGLSIVRHAVQRHGGRVEVDSLLGEGTTFTVTLPIEPVGVG